MSPQSHFTKDHGEWGLGHGLVLLICRPLPRPLPLWVWAPVLLRGNSEHHTIPLALREARQYYLSLIFSPLSRSMHNIQKKHYKFLLCQTSKDTLGLTIKVQIHVKLIAEVLLCPAIICLLLGKCKWWWCRLGVHGTTLSIFAKSGY